MKFLVFTSPTEDGLKRPPTAAAYQALIDELRRAAADGRIVQALHGDSRAIFMVEAESTQAVAALFDALPLAFQTNRTIEPLEDFFDHARRVHGWLAENDRTAAS